MDFTSDDAAYGAYEACALKEYRLNYENSTRTPARDLLAGAFFRQTVCAQRAADTSRGLDQ